MQQQLHGRAQQMLRNRVVTAAASQRSQQHREALIARLDMDASLLLSAFIHSFIHLCIFIHLLRMTSTIRQCITLCEPESKAQKRTLTAAF